MNNYITYTARAKLGAMIDAYSDCIGIKISMRFGHISVEYLFDQSSPKLIHICRNPQIVTDMYTLGLLKEASIDFDYDKQEFIIHKGIT